MFKDSAKHFYTYLPYLYLFLLVWTSCTEKKEKEQDQVRIAVPMPMIDTALLKLDTIAIDSFLVQHALFITFEEDFKLFYAGKKYRFAWFDGRGLIEAAEHLAGHIRLKENDGVIKKNSYDKELFELISQQKAKPLQPLLRLELMLTAQYFNYAKDRWGGAELAKAKDMGWYLPGKKLSYSDLLTKQLAASVKDIEQDAVIPQYIALRKMLNSYQDLESKGKDVLVQDDTIFKKIEIGDSAAVLVNLRNRLVQLGDLKVQAASNVYDQVLADAVVSFKKRHGLRDDTKINDKVIKALNIPLKIRIQQMMVNLERMRWIPLGDHGGRFILVNIPAYQLFFYEDNQLSWDCKVVVGKEMSQTVIFGGNLQYVVFSPYWYVPQGILKKEILPAMKRDPSYLEKHGMEWNNGNVRQKPGADNSLGLVKFIFPNVNDIYLHDTPSKPLFKEEVRAFSHGCIRVEQPKELAKRLLPNWTLANISKAMHSGKEQWISLKAKVPVYIGYFTAYVDSDGQLNFREDIYQRDGRLLEMLMQ